ncbi:MAG: GDYXXLXY domain-containing protein [Paraglaciecola sp.]|nr:GDYXXLXY domain-containing protein [Paraglaciecola sp.]
MNKIIALLGLLLALGLINWSIYVKEQHLIHGDIIKLKLAPVDPRSLMQGDYMALRFELSQAIYEALPKLESQTFWDSGLANLDGWVIVEIDTQGIARFVALDSGQALGDKQRKLQYRVRNGQVKFATNAFFFAEGSADIYDAAQYGKFRVNQQGEVLLTGMLDKALFPLGEQ